MTFTPLDPREQDLLRATLGLRCKQARERLGLTPRALARALQHPVSWVREVEAGQEVPPPHLIAALARATGEPVGWFYGALEPDLEALARRLLEQVAAEGARGREASEAQFVPECFEA